MTFGNTITGFFVLCLPLLGSVLPATSSADALHNYESLLNWSDLPRAKFLITPGLAGSYDRLGYNYDYNNYLWPPGRITTDANTVITELSGPGLITRFWMPHAAANAAFTVRIFVDGILRIDTNSNTFLDGNYDYITSPFVQTLLGGQTSYESIAFQNSLRIESNNFAPGGGWAREHHYYQYNFQLFPPSTVVTPYTGTLTPQQLEARTAVAATLTHLGQNPAGPDPAAMILTAPAQTIPPLTSLPLADLAGPGRIRRLMLKMPSDSNDADLLDIHLRIRYDSLPAWAVDVPVAHFFGAGLGRALYKSLPLGTDSPDGFYSFWPMPFRRQILVELYNSSLEHPVSIGTAQIEYETVSLPCDTGYLHTLYMHEITVANQLYHHLLTINGTGHYVGNILSIEQADDARSILEGDDIITIDPGAASEIILNGTGLEDAYNGGYYYNHVLEQTNDGDIPNPVSGFAPFHGLLYMDFFDLPGFSRTRTDQYRWLIPDFVPFTHGIDVKIENYNAQAGVAFTSTAFYYLIPDTSPICLADFARFASCWLADCTDSDCTDSDLDHSGHVNEVDFVLFVQSWLACP
jgi:hypothetical protein